MLQLGLLIVIGLGNPRFKFPYQGDLNADTEVFLSGGRSFYTSSHPSVLASQVAWITGESQFSTSFSGLGRVLPRSVGVGGLLLWNGLDTLPGWGFLT